MELKEVLLKELLKELLMGLPEDIVKDPTKKSKETYEKPLEQLPGEILEKQSE